MSAFLVKNCHYVHNTYFFAFANNYCQNIKKCGKWLQKIRLGQANRIKLMFSILIKKSYNIEANRKK